eukprot:CAMPEP_0119477020 /NCGR_PEP_ID=MMETSP1344-20130328/7317_1 /TAXON_ID=236787 /ORGANISM="Florenciella parvula, Strain CCMP2471" /LENGTH=468 /DNA_ID=CAMNT_0007510919 /DNA_START=93 /DNA_END=1499 /DNA_ORIENTATION=+
MTGLRTTVLLLGLLAPLSHGELSQSNHLSVLAGSVFSIDDYGAVATENSVEAATANAAALTAALEVAHSAGRGSVLVPSGSVYYTLPFSGSSHVGVSLIVDGVVKACNSNDCQDAWPCTKESHFDYLFEWDNGTDLTLAGHGTIDGQGYKWWWQFLLNKIPGDRKRPGLVYMTSGTGLNVANITLRNSPIMHMHFDNITDDEDPPFMQLAPSELAGIQKWAEEETAAGAIPMLPFNTDGIDPGVGAKDVFIKNLTAENFDDVIAVKPCNGDCAGMSMLCTENIVVENSKIFLGVGLSIGSVNPKDPTNCIKDIVFQGASFKYPFKAVYVKTNSGDTGDGIIQNITYADMTIEDPILWPIYIGPQQQKEPNGIGDGFWPETQPLITISDIFLRNITSTGGFLPHAGILRCNASNPCTNIVIEDVSVESRYSNDGLQLDYVCESMQGTVTKASYPLPDEGSDGLCSFEQI